MAETYQVELVWNRSFNFVPRDKPHISIEAAIEHAKSLENMGDGACVKKTRIVNSEGSVVWQYGKRVNQT